MTLHESSLRIILRDNFKGGFFMSEKMLVTQALDERDLLVKKISDKIDKASFVDTIKPNEDKVYSKRIGKDEYAKEAESAYQQIVDLIERFQKIDAAIVASNAETEITTSYGKFTVAGAISLRSRLRGLGTYDGEADFEGILKSKMQDEYNERVRTCDLKNSQLQNTAESMRLSILGKDSKTKDDHKYYIEESLCDCCDSFETEFCLFQFCLICLKIGLSLLNLNITIFDRLAEFYKSLSCCTKTFR